MVIESLIYLHRHSSTRALPGKMTHLVALVALAWLVVVAFPSAFFSVVFGVLLRTFPRKMTFLPTVVASAFGFGSL